MERATRPTAIPVSSPLPQPTISVQEDKVQASLASGESVTVNLFGATVVSWKLANGEEQLFLSEKAVLDGSKPIRGGIPLVFGPPPNDHATSALPQHGFARNSYWEFLGKSTSESVGQNGDSSVKLDFGLSTGMLSDKFKSDWPYNFGLMYSVTLSKGSLGTSLQVQNKGPQPFDFQVLLHSYFKVEDVTKVRILNLQSKTYTDKVLDASTHVESSPALAITQETDRVYQSLDPKVPILITNSDDSSDNKPLFSISRESLNDVVVWNPWIEKAKGMADFAPQDGYKNMVCVEAGSVVGWQTLEAGETWECGQVVKSKL
ncbi:hypothetical protein ACJ72_01399 [Emergomyces africanus]|uniref:Glucose-6-phosphate 1-epimerase n=1 Tax=Emergomyces africanus TaxID=1955775 RepID=A0A1B7P5R7_9EURO|nr:hypothetical protein ACJ72_01399 [Emergomyces africanus]